MRGELHVRGEQVAGEYLGRGARLAADGFFATRDAAWLDADGYLFLDGRLDDVIVRGGENLSPGEIEDVLREHPDVADCAVVGVPDEQWGEAVAAVIVRAPRRVAERRSRCATSCATGCARRARRSASCFARRFPTPRRESCCAAS